MAATIHREHSLQRKKPLPETSDLKQVATAKKVKNSISMLHLLPPKAQLSLASFLPEQMMQKLIAHRLFKFKHEVPRNLFFIMREEEHITNSFLEQIRSSQLFYLAKIDYSKDPKLVEACDSLAIDKEERPTTIKHLALYIAIRFAKVESAKLLLKWINTLALDATEWRHMIKYCLRFAVFANQAEILSAIFTSPLFNPEIIQKIEWSHLLREAITTAKDRKQEGCLKTLLNFLHVEEYATRPQDIMRDNFSFKAFPWNHEVELWKYLLKHP